MYCALTQTHEEDTPIRTYQNRNLEDNTLQ